MYLIWKDVYAVFIFFNKQIVNSKIKRKPQEIDRVIEMLKKYHESFSAISKTDTEGPVMQQSEKVYAGLTYGNDGLVESSLGGTEYTV